MQFLKCVFAIFSVFATTSVFAAPPVLENAPTNLSGVAFVDWETGSDVASKADGSILRPYKTVTNALNRRKSEPNLEIVLCSQPGSGSEVYVSRTNLSFSGVRGAYLDRISTENQDLRMTLDGVGVTSLSTSTNDMESTNRAVVCLRNGAWIGSIVHPDSIVTIYSDGPVKYYGDNYPNVVSLPSTTASDISLRARWWWGTNTTTVQDAVVKVGDMFPRGEDDRQILTWNAGSNRWEWSQPLTNYWTYPLLTNWVLSRGFVYQSHLTNNYRTWDYITQWASTNFASREYIANMYAPLSILSDYANSNYVENSFAQLSNHVGLATSVLSFDIGEATNKIYWLSNYVDNVVSNLTPSGDETNFNAFVTASNVNSTLWGTNVLYVDWIDVAFAATLYANRLKLQGGLEANGVKVSEITLGDEDPITSWSQLTNSLTGVEQRLTQMINTNLYSATTNFDELWNQIGSLNDDVASNTALINTNLYSANTNFDMLWQQMFRHGSNIATNASLISNVYSYATGNVARIDDAIGDLQVAFTNLNEWADYLDTNSLAGVTNSVNDVLRVLKWTTNSLNDVSNKTLLLYTNIIPSATNALTNAVKTLDWTTNSLNNVSGRVARLELLNPSVMTNTLTNVVSALGWVTNSLHSVSNRLTNTIDNLSYVSNQVDQAYGGVSNLESKLSGINLRAVTNALTNAITTLGWTTDSLEVISNRVDQWALDVPYVQTANWVIVNSAAVGGTNAVNDFSSSASRGAFAQGYKNMASATNSHAEGVRTTASKTGAHSQGIMTTASGRAAHARNVETTASGTGASASGYKTVATGAYSEASGVGALAGDARSFAWSGLEMSGVPGQEVVVVNVYTQEFSVHNGSNVIQLTNCPASMTITGFLGAAQGGPFEWETDLEIELDSQISGVEWMFDNLKPVDGRWVASGGNDITELVLPAEFWTNCVATFSMNWDQADFTWQGVMCDVRPTVYRSHGAGSFNVNPQGGASGFWIGESNLVDTVSNIVSAWAGGSGTNPVISTNYLPLSGGRLSGPLLVGNYISGQTSTGEFSFAYGNDVSPTGPYSFAGGTGSSATGTASTARGGSTVAGGSYSEAGGYGTEAQTYASVSLGVFSKATNSISFVWNGDFENFNADEKYPSHADGSFNVNPVGGIWNFWVGTNTLGEHFAKMISKSDWTTYTNEFSEIVTNSITASEVAENYLPIAGGEMKGILYTSNSIAVGPTNSVYAEGSDIGMGTLALGTNLTVSGRYGFASGRGSSVLFEAGHAEGVETEVLGLGGHTEGYKTRAYQYGHSEGNNTTATNYSHAGGKFAASVHTTSWTWNGSSDHASTNNPYKSHDIGSFNVNPQNGISNFWIGETNLMQHIKNIAGSSGGGGGTWLKGDLVTTNSFTLTSSGSRANNTTTGKVSMAVGYNVVSTGSNSVSMGQAVKNTNHIAFTWSGRPVNSYPSHGDGTFNVDPQGGAAGFYVGTNMLDKLIGQIATNTVNSMGGGGGGSGGITEAQAWQIATNVVQSYSGGGSAMDAWIGQVATNTVNSMGGGGTPVASPTSVYRTIKTVESGDISGSTYTLAVSDGNVQRFISSSSGAATKSVLLPAATNSAELGNLTLYFEEQWSSTQDRFSLATNNIFPSSYPANPPWMNTGRDSTWKLELENPPGTVEWYYIKATEYGYAGE